jgi:integrase
MAISICWREHKAKDGTVTLYARFKTPTRTEGGTVELRPVERSVGAVSRREGARKVEDWYKEDLDAANVIPRNVPTFAEVALTYQRTQGGSPYFKPILLAIGNRPVTDIDQRLMMTLAHDIYPGCSAATINRQLFTPVVAALRLSAGERYAMPMLKRPKGYDSLPALAVPDADWFRKVLPVANPWLRAFLIIGRLHGRRPGELLNRTRSHFNAEAATLLVRDEKGNQNILIDLAEPAYAALCAIPDLDTAAKIKRDDRGKATPRLTKNKREALFGTSNKSTMRKWLVRACAEAGVEYRMAKEAGRHAFATGALEEGKSLVWLKDAGFWKTIKVPAEKYGHLEKQKVHRQARESGEAWFGSTVGELAPAPPLRIESDTQPSPRRPHASDVCSRDVHAQTSANETEETAP